MTHFISPFSTDTPPNIGKAINDAVKQLNAADEDWIIHCDSDTLWLLPDSKRHLIEILSETEFDVVGCMTNRIRNTEQLLDGVFQEHSDVRVHMVIASELWASNGGRVKPVKGAVAAFCLCFKIKTWKLLGGFVENSLSFDSIFSVRARKIKLKVGVCEGIYIFHGYRLLSKNPYSDIKHLL